MSKKDIDKYVTINYQSLIQYASAMIISKNLDEDPEYIISELYFHLMKNRDEITPINIKQYSSTFIYKNANWFNSQIREMGGKQKQQHLVEFCDVLYDREDTDDITTHFEDEVELTDYETIVELYRQSLTSPYKVRVAQAFFDEKRYTVRKFAKYFNFSTTPAMKLIQELKADINEFKNNLEKNNSIRK